MMRLPAELHVKVAGHLDAVQLVLCSRTCKAMQAACEEEASTRLPATGAPLRWLLRYARMAPAMRTPAGAFVAAGANRQVCDVACLHDGVVQHATCGKLIEGVGTVDVITRYSQQLFASALIHGGVVAVLCAGDLTVWRSPVLWAKHVFVDAAAQWHPNGVYAVAGLSLDGTVRLVFYRPGRWFGYRRVPFMDQQYVSVKLYWSFKGARVPKIGLHVVQFVREKTDSRIVHVDYEFDSQWHVKYIRTRLDDDSHFYRNVVWAGRTYVRGRCFVMRHNPDPCLAEWRRACMFVT
jgi:hypothetical protein